MRVWARTRSMRRRRGAPHRRPSAPTSRQTEQVTGPSPLGCGPFSLPGLSQDRPLPGCPPPSRPLPSHPRHPLPDRPPPAADDPAIPTFQKGTAYRSGFSTADAPEISAVQKKRPEMATKPRSGTDRGDFPPPFGMRKGPSPRKHQVAGFLPHANARKPCQNAVSWPETTDFPARTQRRSRSTTRPAFDDRRPEEGSGKPYSSMSMRSILKMTGRVPSLQHAIITRSSLVQPRMIEPPCSAV